MSVYKTRPDESKCAVKRYRRCTRCRYKMQTVEQSERPEQQTVD